MIGRSRVPRARLASAALLVLALTGGGCALLALAARGRALASASGAAWSRASVLAAGCSLLGPPAVAFPSEAPSQPTGPGALAWLSDPSACASAAARGAGPHLVLAALDRSEQPTAPRTRQLPGAPTGQLGAVGATFGRVAVAVGILPSAARAPGTDAALLLQGRAGAALARSPQLLTPGAPLSLTRAYLGDAALATARPGMIAVRVERHYAARFAAPHLIAIGPGAVTSLTATMDFRGDVLVAWQQDGAIYARMLRASGRHDPTQRVGPSAPNPALQALVSDNDHGMLAWSTTRAGGAGTSVYLDLSAAEVRFRAPRRIASFPDPQGLARLPQALALERLSTENVLLAWTAFEHGHYLVRAAPAVYAGRRRAALLSDPARQSLLGGLATGPAAEAVALWSSTAGADARAAGSQTQLWTRRVYLARRDEVASRPAELIASPGAGIEPSIAIDPADDRAIAVWLQPHGRARIEYTVSRGAAGYRPHRYPGNVPAAPSAGVHWLRITAAALLAIAILAATAVALRRRARRRQLVR